MVPIQMFLLVKFRYSMSKKGEVIDLTQMPVCSISPIIHREENNSEFIDDQIMTNKRR